uniref:NADH-ubiquinone oxidoreductase chain 4 n=1 Tax=Vermiviatum covidum TaxID=3348911 RepID=A0A8K1X7B2_9PLAT|nr:NADH dehydrogenase subunit 4 [Humbertium sp. MNHN JL351]
MSNKISRIYLIVLGIIIFFVQNNYSFFVSENLWMGSGEMLDSIAYFFIFLSMLIILYVVVIGINSSLFYFLNVSLLIVLIWFFMSLNALYLFIFFESSFILMFLLIMIWGMNPERIEALNYFLIYSMVGSVPLLIAIVFIQEGLSVMGLFSWVVSSLASGSISHNEIGESAVIVMDLELTGFFLGMDENEILSFFYSSQLVFFFWIVVFLFKFPAFGVHLWLPKAHVESPVFGSMLLAGIMIKLGVVGIFRFFLSGKSMFWDVNVVNSFFFYFCFSIFLVNLICSRQFDLKAFVAYSSVVHMSLILIVIWSGSVVSILGSLFLSFAHGLCSSALFLNLNCFYLVSTSRNIIINSGYLFLSPILCFFWFVFCSVNCSIPISLNFFSEIFLIFSGIGFNLWSFLSFFLNILLCGLYCILLYAYVVHGKSNFVYNFNISVNFMYTYLLVLWYHFFLVYFYFFCFNTISLVF